MRTTDRNIVSDERNNMTFEPALSVHSVGTSQDAEARALERDQQVDVERHVGDAQIGMNFFDGLAFHHLRAALRVVDVHPEQQLHDEMKHAAGELPVAASATGE